MALSYSKASKVCGTIILETLRLTEAERRLHVWKRPGHLEQELSGIQMPLNCSVSQGIPTVSDNTNGWIY